MESWKKVLPDYEIREWSEKDLFRFSDNRYVRQAYEAKKWAFVSDVFRLFALYKEGGIYLDTDVEVRKTFSRCWMGISLSVRKSTGVLRVSVRR